MMQGIKTQHGKIDLPAFMPDATYGSIRTISFKDAQNAGIRELVTTTLHIEQKIGADYINEIGGIHKFFGWDRPILTDSGGWQVFSLINSKKGNPKNRISDVGCSFIDPATGKYHILTPESSILIQSKLGSDIQTVLDNPIIGNASLSERKRSVDMNTRWARRAKVQFEKIYTKTKNASNSKLEINKHIPLLGCVIQGGDDFKLRKQSAEELLEIGFDIYNFGGIPLMSEVTWKNNHPTGFYKEMLHFVSELIPDNKIKYAMGVGQPDDIAFCIEKGWHLFDTVLPTRNARHGYLYVSTGQGNEAKGDKKYSYDILHLRSERYKLDHRPVDEKCDCECCQTVSRAYLRHLIRIKEPAGQRLCTIHNLAFYSKWMSMFR